ncbi:hypothetical protein [Methylobacterium sp. Leaf456]|uniref:hypothetical protein n=1 Tax=Methylobacterium sp. Leaf456 TaxID=1736382 RepID=UPI000AEB2556|nr:hypothetical protein [Methylobacterium sp. Leaf456]
MSDKGLGTILANADARMAELKPAAPVPEQVGRDRLREIATLLGHEADAVLNDFDQGSPLAELVRTVLNIEAAQKPRLGRPLARATFETWFAVARRRQAGLTKESAVAEVAERGMLPGATVRNRYDSARSHFGDDGSSLPATIEGMYDERG